MHEDVTAAVALDEPVTLGVVEPLDLACDTHRSFLLAGRDARVIERGAQKKAACVRPFLTAARPVPRRQRRMSQDTGLSDYMPRALLSVSDKTGLVDLRRGLAARGFELVSTGGTARALAEAGLAVRVSDVTGFPEMMDGRVKTLHPASTAASSRAATVPTTSAATRAHGIGLIDLVVVNLYPFVEGGGEARDAVRRAGRADRHRRAQRWCAPRRRTSATCSSSSIRRTTRGARGSSSAGGPTRRSASS